MTKNYLEGLDDMLTAFINSKLQNSEEVINQTFLTNLDKKAHGIPDYSSRELVEMYIKLKKDGFVRGEYGNSAFVTIEGIIWNQSGGYVANKIRSEEQDRIHKRNEKILSKYTKWLAIGTIGLVLVELTKFIFEIFLKHN